MNKVNFTRREILEEVSSALNNPSLNRKDTYQVMNNPNPFVPQGSLLEQQSNRRSRLKLGVFCVLAVGISGLAAMLIQGCKREEQNPPESDNNPPPMQTNDVTATETNLPTSEIQIRLPGKPPPPGAPQAPVSAAPPTRQPPAPVVPAAPAPAENQYVVVKGDTLAKIAKANGTTVKALEEANQVSSPPGSVSARS